MTDRMKSVLSLLWQMSLASVSNLASRLELRGTSRTATINDLEWLYAGDYVGRIERGWRQKAKLRYFLTSKGIAAAMAASGESLEWGVTEAALKRLLRQGQLVEMLYDTAPVLFGSNAVCEDRRRQYPLVKLEWLSQGPVAAMAEYQLNFRADAPFRRLTVPFVWYGIRPKPNLLPRELNQWPDGVATSCGQRKGEPARLSGVVILAADRLSGMRARRDLAPDIPRAIVTVDDANRWSVIETMQPSIFTAATMTSARTPAGPGVPERVETHLERDPVLSNCAGRTDYKLLTAIEEWPGCRAGQLARLCRHPASAVRRAVDRFAAAGLVEREGGGEIYPTDLILRAAEERDRLGHRKTRGRAGAERSPSGGRRIHMSRHESGVIELAIRFRQERIFVAAGWRMVVDHHGQTQVSPDLWALIPMGDGRGLWHGVEYERSATSEGAIERKLRPYRAALEMGMGLPLLMVCETEAAATRFEVLGAELPMSVAVYRDVQGRPFNGPTSPWQRDGATVDVGHLSRVPLCSRENRERWEYILVEGMGMQL